MNSTYRIFRATIFAGISMLLIVSMFIWPVNSSAAQSTLTSPMLALSEHFDDGEMSTNPTWTYNNDAFSIIDGQLHSDGLHTDGSDRYSNFYRTFPTFATADYLEFSFRAKLKSTGNPQAGRGVKLLVIDASGYPCYELRIQNGYVDGFPINHNSMSFGYCANSSLYDVVVSNFAPEYDRFYNIKAVRSNGEFSLFVDDLLIGQAPDPLGLTQFGSVFIVTVGSAVIDDIEVVTADPQTNQPPTVHANGPFSVSQGGSVVVTASGNDPEGGALTYAWDLDNNGIFETPGQNVTFSAIGLEAPSSHLITVQVTDEGGLSASHQALVNVVYNFNGFFQPIDNLPTLNMMKAGQAVPVKFSLSGYQGLGIFATGYPTSSAVVCGSTSEDAVEQTSTAGSSSLTYDANTDQYVYIWKTDKAWAGTCRTFVMKLSDGTYHRASFKLK